MFQASFTYWILVAVGICRFAFVHLGGITLLRQG